MLSWSPGDALPDTQSLKDVGFDALLIAAPCDSAAAEQAVKEIGPTAAKAGLKVVLDVELDSFPIDHPLVDQAPDAFLLKRKPAGDGPVDPRRPGPPAGEARARLKDPTSARQVLPAIVERLRKLMDGGIAGFSIRRIDSLPADVLDDLARELKRDGQSPLLIAHAPGASRDALAGLRGIDAIHSSFAYWDLAAPWLAEEYEALRLTAPVLSPVAPDGRTHRHAAEEARRRLLAAALMGNGMVVPSRLLVERPEEVKGALEASRSMADFSGEMRFFTNGGTSVVVRAQSSDVRLAERLMIGLVNRSSCSAAFDEAALMASLGADLQAPKRLRGRMPAFTPLAPFEVRLLAGRRAKPIAARRHGNAAAAREAAGQPRLVIESTSPEVDSGAFPAKRTVGEQVTVEAVFFGDGHEQLAAELRWRALDEKDWHTARMEERGNDRWTASFPLERIGPHEFQVQGWLDRFGTFRRDIIKKLDAGVAQPVDLLEGRNLVEAAGKRVRGELGRRLASFVKAIDAASQQDDKARLLLDAELGLLMDEADERPFAVTSGARRIESERLQARFSSWYELFPRSQSDRADRHGTFDDVITRLPQIRAMGFDTLYFPPIHPIGRKHRKGRNNTLTPAPDDPGSPYAIGSDEGGHTAIHPELGSLEDFRRLVSEAHCHGLEIALDFAIQCSPDHPWLKEHPGWFDWRPDGTIKYAENPPKKYQDIVNVDFYTKDAVPGLWLELRDVVLFWIGQGVKVFRVDNPHTKPFAFWQWMIADIRGVHPDTIFLSEAFTRPAVMYRLAKIGFSQSYTYFTWRNSKQELIDYLTELTTSEVREFFRPHFFVNTPDINPTFLHSSGRPGFQIRAALAATLSGLFGVYSGFELCEAQPVPGKEEYWESEKYEVKPRDWQAPGNIIEDITLLNRLRRANPALQSHLGLTFYQAWNDQILYFGKRAPGADDMILVAISLDPHNAQEAGFEVPLWEWGIGDDGTITVEDLIAEQRFSWTGKVQHMRLTPERPYAIWRIAPGGGPA